MATKAKTVAPEKIQGANVENIPPIGGDSTQTKGKVSSKFTIVDDSDVIDSIEKQSKNEVFAAVTDYFCPIKFDDTLLRQSLLPLVESGVMSEDVFQSTLQKAKKEFLDSHSDEIAKGEKLTFVEVVNKLKENDTLYQRVLQACNVTELIESRYINDNKVNIYRAAQSTDRDGKDKYFDVTLSMTENGHTFTSGLFVERRDVTTSNIILAIRYYSSKDDAERKLWRMIQDYRKILTFVGESAKKAFANGFSLESVLAKVEDSFHAFQLEQNI